MKRPLVLMVIAALSVGCGNKLTRRHDRASSEGIPSDLNRFSVSVVVLPVPQAEQTQKSFFDLDGRGQAAAIEVAGVDGKKERLDNVKALVGITVKPSSAPSLVRWDRPKARLVTNLIHRPFTAGSYDSADRVVWSEVRVSLQTEQFKIISYDKVDTGYETVDLGKLTRSANWKVSGTAGTSAEAAASVSPSEGNSASTKTTNGASVAAEAGETLGEEVALRRRYTSLAVSLAPSGQTVGILREGVSGVDLTGSTTIDVQLGARNPQSTQFFTAELPKKPGDRLSLTSGNAAYASCNRFLISSSAMAVVRHVVGKEARTISEHDDRVIFKWFSAPEHSGDAVYSFEMEPVVLYRLKTRDGSVIKVREGGRALELILKDESEAFKLRSWLEASFNQLGVLQDPERPFVDDSSRQLSFGTDPGFTVEADVKNKQPCPQEKGGDALTSAREGKAEVPDVAE